MFDASPAVAETEWESLVAAIIKIERSTNVRQPATGLWKLSLETSFLPIPTKPPGYNGIMPPGIPE